MSSNGDRTGAGSNLPGCPTAYSRYQKFPLPANRHRVGAQQSDAPAHFGLKRREYALLTLHQPSDVEVPEVFVRLLGALITIQKEPSCYGRGPRSAKPSIVCAGPRLSPFLAAWVDGRDRRVVLGVFDLEFETGLTMGKLSELSLRQTI
jgi:hypothetical protein